MSQQERLMPAACSGEGPLPEAAMERLRELWASDFGRGLGEPALSV